jgi:hypothetical protein
MATKDKVSMPVFWYFGFEKIGGNHTQKQLGESSAM